MKTILSAVVGATLALSVAESVAQEPFGHKQVALAIESQTLASALDQWAEQTGIIVIQPSWEAAKRVVAPSLKGTFSAQEALERLVAGTPLTYTWLGERAVVVREAPSATSSHTSGKSSDDSKPSTLHVAMLAAQDTAGGSRDSQSSAPLPDVPGSRIPIDEVVVTGTYIRNSAGPVGEHVTRIDQQAIRESGRGTVAEVLQLQPQLHGAGPTDTNQAVGRSADNLGFASGINLRGLGVEETLTLLNGRRIAPGGFNGQFGDISTIPAGAVDRIEILADGASATYGADAMAGVVNILLRKDLDGAQSRVRYGSFEGSSADDVQVDQLFGHDWGSGSVTAGYGYQHRSALAAENREFSSNCDQRALGGLNNCNTLSNPGNIIFPTALVGAIPTGQDGRSLQAADILIGQTNFQNSFQQVDIVPELERHSLFLSASQELSPALTAYADLFAAQRTTNIHTSAQTATLQVPVTNAYRQLNGLVGGSAPLNQPFFVQYSFLDDLGPNTQEGTSRALSGAVGTVLEFASSWRLDVHGTYGRGRSTNSSPILDTRPAAQGGTLATALASSDLSSAFNPFADGSGTNSAVLDTLVVPTQIKVTTDYWSANAKIDGDLFTLPGGAVKLAVGGEYRDETFDFVREAYYAGGIVPPPTLAPVAGDRTVNSAYAEILLPIVSSQNSIPGFNEVSISASGRWDRYSDFGDTTNPRIGLRWRPVEGIALRGSYGTSFKAPLLQSLFSASLAQVAPFPAALTGGFDPNGDGFATVLIVSGGNRDLVPEEGQTWTAGLDITMSERFRLHATYFDIHFRDRLATFNSLTAAFFDPVPYQGAVYFPQPSQALVDKYLASPTQLITPPPAPGVVEAILDTTIRNLSIVDMDGIDLSAEYSLPTAIGDFQLTANATHTIAYDQKFTATAPTQSLLNQVGQPVDWRVRGGIGWRHGPYIATIFANYVDSYRDAGITPNRPVDSWTTVDLYMQLDLGSKLSQSKWAEGVQLSVSATNVLDEDPPYVASSAVAFGFDAPNANPLGRGLAIELTKSW